MCYVDWRELFKDATTGDDGKHAGVFASVSVAAYALPTCLLSRTSPLTPASLLPTLPPFPLPAIISWIPPCLARRSDLSHAVCSPSGTSCCPPFSLSSSSSSRRLQLSLTELSHATPLSCIRIATPARPPSVVPRVRLLHTRTLTQSSFIPPTLYYYFHHRPRR